MPVTYVDPRSEMTQFLPSQARVILDIGCSSGEFGRVLRRCHQDLTLVGMEPNPDAVELASRTYDTAVAGLFPQDAGQLPDLRYDAVFFNDVLEHMQDPASALRAAQVLLSPDGVVIASIPNVRHVSVIGPLVLWGDFRYRDSGILDKTHLRFFTRKSIVRIFEDAGWTLMSLSPINRVLHVGQTRSPWWIRLAGRLTGGWTDGLFTVQYVVVARPRTGDKTVVGNSAT